LPIRRIDAGLASVPCPVEFSCFDLHWFPFTDASVSGVCLFMLAKCLLLFFSVNKFVNVSTNPDVPICRASGYF
jgi:hypothetical protein